MKCNNWADVKKDPRVEFCVVGAKNKGYWAYLKPAWLNKASQKKNPNTFWGICGENFVYSDKAEEVIDIVNNHLHFVP